MKLEAFDYNLPDDLIASVPLERRDASRMLHVNRRTQDLADRKFLELPDLLRAGDRLVLNDTSVFPARLLGKTETGANVEILLAEEIAPLRWTALARPARRLKAGKMIVFDQSLTCEVIENHAGGNVMLAFATSGDFWDELYRLGKTPLPHYIKRASGESFDDRRRYQTVYASERGAIAAPTAGLHFTDSLLGEFNGLGIGMSKITLHVGYGTFEPVRVTELSEHRVLPERLVVSEVTASELNATRRDGGRIVAVGTTTTRALESIGNESGEFIPTSGRTKLTVTPAYRFRAVDAMLTNFHLPRSSLLILVSTFGGHQLIMSAYEHAVRSRYRFYSYGDCMFIE